MSKRKGSRRSRMAQSRTSRMKLRKDEAYQQAQRIASFASPGTSQPSVPGLSLPEDISDSSSSPTEPLSIMQLLQGMKAALGRLSTPLSLSTLQPTWSPSQDVGHTGPQSSTDVVSENEPREEPAVKIMLENGQEYTLVGNAARNLVHSFEETKRARFAQLYGGHTIAPGANIRPARMAPEPEPEPVPRTLDQEVEYQLEHMEKVIQKA